MYCRNQYKIWYAILRIYLKPSWQTYNSWKDSDLKTQIEMAFYFINFFKVYKVSVHCIKYKADAVDMLVRRSHTKDLNCFIPVLSNTILHNWTQSVLMTSV